ncbi:MAG: hypothetical protein AB7S44_03060 [Spirochaetales bacterium]
MAYEYVEKQEREDLVKVCESIICEVQNEVREYFTFEFKLIGSGEKRLITRNGKTGCFDLDYNLILQKDKKELISYPQKIKEIFMQAFNGVNPKNSFADAKNSTSVITSNLKIDDRLLFSFDVAILIEGNNGSYYKLIYDKPSQRYIWNEQPHSANYKEKFSQIKKQGYWMEFKERYLEKKNYYLSRDPEKKSYVIFLETINEFYKG